MRAVVLAVLLASCSQLPTAEAPTLPFNPVQYAVDHTVYLEGSGCTGIVVGPNRVVTAKHCLPDEALVGQDYEGGILVHISPSHDFAIVAKSTNLLGFIEMRTHSLGEHLYVVGYPVQLESNEQELTVTDGVAAGPANDDGEARITAPVYFGNSGGGVWSDDGQLLGVAVSIYAAAVEGYRYPLPYAGQSFMVPISYVEVWL